ncbi:MAG: bifunctional biotin--[acetyl-CoA-carboxylase] ligase/biotin operon repressor BirA [Pseudomonadota bacterium]
MLYTLIQLLSDGEFHSGEEVGQHLGVSRTAVWKQLQKLSAYGLEVQSQKGKGYRLSAPLELLDADAIQQSLNPIFSKELITIEVLVDTDSTSDCAMARVKAGGSAHGYCCFAEYQRKGRGRRGRQWQSPFGRNLYFSLVWEFEGGATVLEGLSLVMGLAIVRALSALGVEGLLLKWPNDILLNKKKLGGILLEMAGDPAGHCQVVIGVGLNMAMSANQPDIDQPWSNLPAWLNPSRNALAAAVINAMARILIDYADSGFASYREQWQQFDAFLGQRVRLSAGDQVQEGIAVGVADNGAIILEVEGQRQLAHGGELSLTVAGL